MNKRITLTIATAFTLTAILTGCGNDEDLGYREVLGCPDAVEEDSPQMFAQNVADCATKDGTVSVYTFASTEARDNWIRIATSFGGEITAKGKDWAAMSTDY